MLDNKFWVDEITRLYLAGFTVKEALDITKKQRKEYELKKIREEN